MYKFLLKKWVIVHFHILYGEPPDCFYVLNYALYPRHPFLILLTVANFTLRGRWSTSEMSLISLGTYLFSHSWKRNIDYMVLMCVFVSKQMIPRSPCISETTKVGTKNPSLIQIGKHLMDNSDNNSTQCGFKIFFFLFHSAIAIVYAGSLVSEVVTPERLRLCLSGKLALLAGKCWKK